MVNLNFRKIWADSMFERNGASDVSVHFERCCSLHSRLISSIVVQSGKIKRIVEKRMCMGKIVLGPSNFIPDILSEGKPADFGGCDQQIRQHTCLSVICLAPDVLYRSDLVLLCNI